MLFSEVKNAIHNAGIDAIEIDDLIEPDIEFSQDESLDRFILFCKKNGIKDIFYRLIKTTIDRKPVDANKVKEKVREYYVKLFQSFFTFSFYSFIVEEDFEPYIDKLNKEIDEDIEEYNRSIGSIFELEEIVLNCVYNGKFIGFSTDNNDDEVETDMQTEESFASHYWSKAKECYNQAEQELRKENKRREEQRTIEYEAELQRIKGLLKDDPVFRSIKTKQEKHRYAKDYYRELEKDYKPVATKVSFKEMIDDAISELEKEKYKSQNKL